MPYITFQAPKRRVDVEWKKFRSEAKYKNNCCNRVCRINATGKSFPLKMCGHLGRYYFRWKVTCRIYQLELFPSGKAETCIRKVLFSLYKLIPNQSNKANKRFCRNVSDYAFNNPSLNIVTAFIRPFSVKPPTSRAKLRWHPMQLRIYFGNTNAWWMWWRNLTRVH